MWQGFWGGGAVFFMEELLNGSVFNGSASSIFNEAISKTDST